MIPNKSTLSNSAASAVQQSQPAPLSLEDLPDRETLIRFADGTLRGRQKRAIQRLANQHPEALQVIAHYVRLYTPIRLLCSQWLGWRGAILYALGRLPRTLARDWEAHCERCWRSRVRTQLMRVALTPVRALRERSEPQPRSALRRLSFAFGFSGWTLALVLLVVQLRSPAPTTNATQIKSDPTHDPVLLAFAPEFVDPEVLQYRIDYFEWLIEQNPNVPEFHSALARHCRELARLTTDPTQRRELLDKAARHEAREQQLKKTVNDH